MGLLGHIAESMPCLHTAGLVTSLTGAEADSVLGCVNWAGQAPSPDLLGRCAAVDEKAAALFLQRDQALLSTTAVLLVLAHSPSPFMLLAMHLAPRSLHVSCGNMYAVHRRDWYRDSLAYSCHVLDEQSYSRRATAREEHVLKALPSMSQLLNNLRGLQEYSAALQQILPGDYAASSQHAKWSTAFAASLTAQTKSLQAEQRSIEHVQVCTSVLG